MGEIDLLGPPLNTAPGPPLEEHHPKPPGLE